MGRRLPPLTRREVTAVLLHNGFAALPEKATSHTRYRGTINGRSVFCDVDAGHNEFVPRSRTAFYWLVKGQLGLTFEQFYAGHEDTARRAGLSYKPFGGS